MNEELEAEIERLEQELARTDDHSEELEELRDCVDELERENERLQRERRQILKQHEENTELIRYAQSEREAAERREKWRQSNVFRRAWWWVAGAPTEDSDM